MKNTDEHKNELWVMNSRVFYWAAACLIIGFLLGMGIFWLTYNLCDIECSICGSECKTCSFECILTDIFSHLFTLIVACVTAIIALWGVRQQIQSNAKDISRQIENSSKGVSRQISHSTKIFEKTRLDKLDSERSILPIVLNNISDLCEKRYYALANGRLGQEKGELWEISANDLSTLKACIQYADESDKHWLKEIIRTYQVLVARWNGIEEVVNLFSEINKTERNRIMPGKREYQLGNIRDWITLQTTCVFLFDYARGGKIEFSNNEIRESVIFRMKYIKEGGPNNTGIVTVLVNNSHCEKFISKLESGEVSFPFVDTIWFRSKSDQSGT